MTASRFRHTARANLRERAKKHSRDTRSIRYARTHLALVPEVSLLLTERPMYPVDDLFAAYARGFEANREAEMTLPEYLEACRDNPMMYATATERLLAAIGEPEMVDTAKDARLGRIFMNRTIRVYPAFSEFYGMEETIERIVGFLRHAAQGLEERKQIMYLLGPVGGGKSSLAERLKALMEDASHLCAEGRRPVEPGVRKPARAVQSRAHGRRCWRTATASRSGG